MALIHHMSVNKFDDKREKIDNFVFIQWALGYFYKFFFCLQVENRSVLCDSNRTIYLSGFRAIFSLECFRIGAISHSNIV